MKKEKEDLKFWISVIALFLSFEFFLISLVFSNLSLMLYFWINFAQFIMAYSIVNIKYKNPQKTQLSYWIWLFLTSIILSIFILFLFKYVFNV
jgi:hypothetical protein